MGRTARRWAGEVAGVERVVALLHQREQAGGPDGAVGGGCHEGSFLAGRRRGPLGPATAAVRHILERQVIADAAARLFAQRGYERVAVSDVAREAEVSEQTAYNYFQTKDQLVTDRDQLIQDELSRLIRTRAPGTTPAAAIREFVLGTVEGIRRIPAEQWRGELGFLAAISPAVHRLSLQMSDRQASALALAIAETDAVPSEVAKL